MKHENLIIHLLIHPRVELFGPRHRWQAYDPDSISPHTLHLRAHPGKHISSKFHQRQMHIINNIAMCAVLVSTFDILSAQHSLGCTRALPNLYAD